MRDDHDRLAESCMDMRRALTTARVDAMARAMPYPMIRPLLFRLDAERAHRLTVRALGVWAGYGAPLAPRVPDMPVTVAGLTFRNPLGLAAGVDKDAACIAGFLALGFGAVEVGTLTPRAQAGNPTPRLFRLVEDAGVINRMGFNNGGIDAALPRIAAAPRGRGIVGVNVGANKDSTDRVADYATGVAKAATVGDYVTINISSPNTPGLRDLQEAGALAELLAESARARVLTDGTRRPLFLKIAPDLDRASIDAIVRVAIESGVDALIVANTTITRPPTLRGTSAGETGGLSGAPLRDLARATLAAVADSAGGAIPLVSVGGIDGADEAKRRIDMGASLVQLYSALVFRGPGLAAEIVRGLQVSV